MRKLIICLLLAVLSMSAVSGAYAETAYRVAGYDHQDTGHEWQTSLFFQRMEEKTGVKLDLTQYKDETGWNKAKADLLAGQGDVPDALFKANLTTQETQALYEAGKIIDLAPYLPEHAPDLWALLQANPEWLEAITLPGSGAIAALPSIDTLQFNNALWVNKSWLSKVGKAMPTTAEELTDVLRAFKAHDLNGNGKADEIPLTFSSLWDLRFLAHAFGINANDYYLTTDENGKVQEILTSDANRAFLTWLNQLWSEGLLDKDGFSGLRDLSRSATSGNDEKVDVTYGFLMSATPVELVPVASIADYVLVPPMTYEGKQVYRDLTGDVVRGTFAITSACADPAALVKWVNYLYTEEGFILSEVGLEGEEFTWNDDGTWLWEGAAENLSSLLADATMRSGISMPGWVSTDFQLKIDDAATRHVVASLMELKAIDTLPVPMVYLTAQQHARVHELQYALGLYAEYQMTWFVTGDVELNDATWNDFCLQVKAHGVDEIVEIFQTAVDAQR